MNNENKQAKLALYDTIKIAFQDYSKIDIENGIMRYYFDRIGIESKENNLAGNDISEILYSHDFPIDLESIIELFEVLLEQNNKDENGIVFTPEYIADYISSSVFADAKAYENTWSIIDPGCGCGMFLVSAAEYIHRTYKIEIDTVIEHNIFGIDLDPDNARRCELVLRLLSAKYGGNYKKIKINIRCNDSLDSEWNKLFGITKFDFIIGNPPYVNPHDMNKNTVSFLKNHFVTTQSGVFNIFYAFIEQSIKYLSEKGKLGFIVPNNFLSIKSAIDLRDYLQRGNYLEKIIDFGDNMVFRPVRTYNCIIVLSNKKQTFFEYAIVPTTGDIEGSLNNLSFDSMDSDRLDKNGWKLVDELTHKNLNKIEAQFIPIKEFIRTGIATLKDGAYLVEKDEKGYYKRLQKRKEYIEDALVKPIYKIPDLKLSDSIDDVTRYIIFPYIKSKTGYVLIDEDEFMSKYPQTYSCLLEQKEILDGRDKGKGNSQGWYAYGRTQGLNKYGKKLLFPTFSNCPKFIYVDNEDALFCNGYAVFENDRIDLKVLQKILNSAVMKYYVSNTSYSIEGGYYCFQKKYIERFSIPYLEEAEISNIQRLDGQELDEYLWKLYELK